MDRLPRQFFVACALGLLAVGTGCRSTRPEVPPGRPFAPDGRQRKAIEFSSDGHPMSAAATANIMPDTANGGSKLAQGIDAGSRPDGGSYSGVPGGYGPPGTSGRKGDPGLGQPPKLDSPPLDDPGAIPASMGPAPMPNPLAPAPMMAPKPPPPSDAPAMPDPMPAPAPTAGPAPASSEPGSRSQTIQSPLPQGRMGGLDQLPSPM